MQDLGKIRKQIDDIDKKMLILLDRRARLSLKTKKVKLARNSGIINLNRETQIVDEIAKNYEGIIHRSDIKLFQKNVISICRGLETKPVVGILGPEYTFSHIAAIKKIGPKAKYILHSNIADVFKAAEKKTIDFGIVPVENSIFGTVYQTLDSFVSSNVKIVSETNLKIVLNLVSKSKRLSSIKTVYSHPQPLGQSNIWLTKNIPNAKLIEVSSTAKAAELAAKDISSSAISTSEAAKKYKLGIIGSDISNIDNNVTRFFVITHPDNSIADKLSNKTSIMFTIKHQSGALVSILEPFKKLKINLTKIESRPNMQNMWEYYFFVDFLGNTKDKVVKTLMKSLSRQCHFMKILGSYKTEEV